MLCIVLLEMEGPLMRLLQTLPMKNGGEWFTQTQTTHTQTHPHPLYFTYGWKASFDILRLDDHTEPAATWPQLGTIPDMLC